MVPARDCIGAAEHAEDLQITVPVHIGNHRIFCICKRRCHQRKSGHICSILIPDEQPHHQVIFKIGLREDIDPSIRIHVRECGCMVVIKASYTCIVAPGLIRNPPRTNRLSCVVEDTNPSGLCLGGDKRHLLNRNDFIRPIPVQIAHRNTRWRRELIRGRILTQNRSRRIHNHISRLLVIPHPCGDHIQIAIPVHIRETGSMGIERKSLVIKTIGVHILRPSAFDGAVIFHHIKLSIRHIKPDVPFRHEDHFPFSVAIHIPNGNPLCVVTGRESKKPFQSSRSIKSGKRIQIHPHNFFCSIRIQIIRDRQIKLSIIDLKRIRAGKQNVVSIQQLNAHFLVGVPFGIGIHRHGKGARGEVCCALPGQIADPVRGGIAHGNIRRDRRHLHGKIRHVMKP